MKSGRARRLPSRRTTIPRSIGDETRSVTFSPGKWRPNACFEKIRTSRPIAGRSLEPTARSAREDEGREGPSRRNRHALGLPQRTNFAGTPIAKAPGGTSARTREFAPIEAPSPTVTSPSTVAPAPMKTSLPMRGEPAPS